MDIIQEMKAHLRTIELDALRQIEDALCCTGVSLTQCHLLLEIEDEGRSPGDLAQALRLDKSTLSRSVDALVKNGIVRRLEQQDRRYQTVELTEEGRRLVDTVNGTLDAFYRSLLGNIPKSRQRSVVAALGEISAAIRALVRPAGACCGRKGS